MLKVILFLLGLFTCNLLFSQTADDFDKKHYFYKYMNNGFIAYQKGDVDNAIYFFETAHKTFPTDTAPLLNLMYIALDKKDYDKALLYAESLQANNYHKSSLYTLISTIKYHKGNTTEAIKILNEGLEKNNNDKSLLLLKSNFEIEAEQELAAIQTLEKIIAITNETHYYATIGILYENADMPDSAQIAYETCLKNDISNEDAISGLSAIHYEKAELLQYKAQELPIESITLFKEYIINSKNEYALAKKYIEKAIALNPKEAAYKDLLLRIERKLIE